MLAWQSVPAPLHRQPRKPRAAHRRPDTRPAGFEPATIGLKRPPEALRLNAAVPQLARLCSIRCLPDLITAVICRPSVGQTFRMVRLVPNAGDQILRWPDGSVYRIT